MDMIEGFEFMNHFPQDDSDWLGTLENYMPTLMQLLQFMALVSDKHDRYTSVGPEVNADGCDSLQHLIRVLESVFNSDGANATRDDAIPVTVLTVLDCGCTFGFLQTILTGKVCPKHRQQFDIAKGNESAFIDVWIANDYQHLVAERLVSHRKIFEPIERIDKARQKYEDTDIVTKLLNDIRGID